MTSDQGGSQMAGKMVRVFARLRDIYPRMTVSQAVCLLYVAANPDCSPRDLAGAVELDDGVVSRTLAILSDVGFRDAGPLNLVEIAISRTDRRGRDLRLTEKGRVLMKQLARELNDN